MKFLDAAPPGLFPSVSQKLCQSGPVWRIAMPDRGLIGWDPLSHQLSFAPSGSHAVGAPHSRIFSVNFVNSAGP